MREKELAQQTVAALEAGQYTTPNGDIVSIAMPLKVCVESTHCYAPDDLSTLRDQVLAQPAKYERTTFEVANEGTLSGCARLFAAAPDQRIGALNFASAKNPGGGFLGGARAQEESLARSSGLYASLLKCPAYYEYHRHHKSLLYSDWMIYSPACPVLRNDQGQWLQQPYPVDFITSPAHNAGAIADNEPQDVVYIPRVFRERSGKVLALAAHHGCDTLVLGAWGCGVFSNDPQLVALIFWEHLNPQGAFWGRFQKVRFSVLDRDKKLENYRAFAERFANGA